MKIIKDTLRPVIERWDDPGDYPSSAGSGPLASYDYVAEVEGEIVLEMESNDFIEGLGAIEYDLPHGIKVTQWDVSIHEGSVALTVSEFSANPVESEYPDFYLDYDPEN